MELTLNQQAISLAALMFLRGNASFESSLHDEEIAADRKSTRLNSSHLGISYAVFCLKKNKKRHHKHI